MIKKDTPFTKYKKPFLLLAALLILLVVASLQAHKSSNRQNPLITQPATISPKPSGPAASGAGKTSGRGVESTSVATPTIPKPSNTTIVKPVGQLLNKTLISLSAKSDDLQHNSAMVSTIISAAAGSTNTITATNSSGTKITVGKAVVADASGQGSEVDWDAKSAGLTVGVWQIRIESVLNGAAAASDSAQLTVEK